MEDRNEIQLSPSSLNLYLECPRCFWLYKVKKIHRPEGLMSSLPTALDLLIKKHFDKYRAKGKLPPELVGKVDGKPIDNQQLLNHWRSRKGGLRYKDKKLDAVLLGLLDECFTNEDFYIPVDYKTRGFSLKSNSTSFYQNQLNCYTFLLEANGYKHKSFGYLVYYIAREVREHGHVHFQIEPKKLDTYPAEALKLFEEAVLFLRGPQPAFHSNSHFCSLGQKLYQI